MPIVTEGRAVIDTSAQIAWTVLADYSNDPLWRQGVTRMEQSPPGEVFDGAIVVEELHVLGRLTRTRIEVRDVRPGVSFAWRAVDGTDARGTRSLVPLGEGRCELRTWRQIRLRGADRLLGPLVAGVMARAERGDVHRAVGLVTERLRKQV